MKLITIYPLKHNISSYARRDLQSKANRESLVLVLEADGSPEALKIATTIRNTLTLGLDDPNTVSHFVPTITKITG